MRSKSGFLTSRRGAALAFGAFVLLASAGAGAADPARERAPAAQDPSHLRLDYLARAVSFTLSPDKRADRTLAFAKGSAALGRDAESELAKLHTAFETRAGRNSAFVVLVDGRNEALAFQRARSVRDALIARRSGDAAAIVAAAFPTTDADDGARAQVRLVALDAGACAGCGASSLKTLALDSDVARLVRAGEADAAGRPLGPAVAFHPAPAPARETRTAARGCARPKVVIDDYWRGGPMVACDGTPRRSARTLARAAL